MARPARWLKPLSVTAVGGMLAAVLLGFFASGSGPMPHAALGLSSSVASILAHVRRGGGADLGASLILGLGVMLGMGVPDGVVGAGVHWVVATAGVALSSWVHLGRLRPGAAPKT